MYQESWVVCASIASDPQLEGRVKKLQAAIKFGQDDLVAVKGLVDQCPMDDTDTEVNFGCLLYKVRT